MIVIFPMAAALDTPGPYQGPLKPLISIGSRLMIEEAVSPYIGLKNTRFIFVINSAELQKQRFDSVLTQLMINHDHHIKSVRGDTSGALATVLVGIADENLDQEVIVSNYDQSIDLCIEEALESFRRRNLDFGAISFASLHPKWSYVKLDDNELIIEAREKNPISRNALAGFYYFRSGREFFDAAKSVILNAPIEPRVNYISDVLNEFVLLNRKGGVFPIRRSQYFNFSEQEDMELFKSRVISSESHLGEKFFNIYFDAISELNERGFKSCLAKNIVIKNNFVELTGIEAVIDRFINSDEEPIKYNKRTSKIYSLGDSYISRSFVKIGSKKFKGFEEMIWTEDGISRIDGYFNEY